jgi:DNA-binding XRE family transcriptional regulator
MAIIGTRYYRDNFGLSQPIPKDVLAGYAEHACQCRLDSNSAERSLIQDVILGTEAPDSGIEYLDIERRLAAQRRRRYLTQEERAEVAGLTPSTISQIERGIEAPRLSPVKRLAAAPFTAIGRASTEAADRCTVRRSASEQRSMAAIRPGGR